MLIAQLQRPSVAFGCDPEFFLRRGGRVIGSELVIPPKGRGMLSGRHYYGKGPEFNTGAYKAAQEKEEKYGFVRDGVQVELNPSAHTCRANLGNEIKQHFWRLKDYLDEKFPDVTVDFSQVVVVRKKELSQLAPSSQVLGCMPSMNFYNPEAKIRVNGATYMKRSGGGHLHFGFSSEYVSATNAVAKLMLANRVRMVPLLDLLVGNTAVLIDRDPHAALRRRNYGRAGEFRTPSYGIEYRTLSNFWLKSYQLMSLLTGLGRYASAVLYTSAANQRDAREGQPFFDPERILLSAVDIKQVEKAINTNDFDLAKKNFDIVKQVMKDDKRFNLSEAGLYPSWLEAFDFFVEKVNTDGMDYWFPLDPLTHWSTLTEAHDIGWESFLTNIVARRMKDPNASIVPTKMPVGFY